MLSPRNKYEIILRDAGCSNSVIEHCRAVTECALDIATNNTLIDYNLLEVGSMLHDIGRGITHSIHHAQAGADYCRSIGIPEPVARIVERHTGAGLSADECTLLGLLPRECIPKTLEEKIVAHADNLIDNKKKGTIHEALYSAIHLNRKVRHRMYCLALDVEILCKKKNDFF
ncbi:MAG: HDIG domain-containing metalloprotein [Methanoregulaceae archaeon]|jgi:uncharacterized protein